MEAKDKEIYIDTNFFRKGIDNYPDLAWDITRKGRQWHNHPHTGSPAMADQLPRGGGGFEDTTHTPAPLNHFRFAPSTVIILRTRTAGKEHKKPFFFKKKITNASTLLV